jgi:o-succinylbenzoate---CoA ligase
MHSLFKINNRSFTTKSFQEYIKDLLNSNDVYLQDIGSFLEKWIDDKTYIIVSTSGSTGRPKEIKLDKKHMKNSALATGVFFDLKENTKALLCLSSSYIAGKMMLVRALVLGWDIHLVSPISNPLKNLNQNYDFCAMVPLQVSSSLNDLYKIKKIIIGGGVVSLKLQNKLQTVKSFCYATYGMTETITHIAVKPLNNFLSHKNNSIELNYYKVLPNIILSTDTRDCLVINAPGVSEEPVVTNDIVKLISATKFEWLGRYDNVINSAGIKLYPEQIEQKLSKIIKKRFFVAGVLNNKFGQQLVLLIETDEEIEFSKSDFNKCNLDKYEIPKEIINLKQFIETSTGKIQRNETLKLIY